MPSRTLASILSAAALGSDEVTSDLLEDFGSATGPQWRFISDGVMGGISGGQVTIHEVEGHPVLHLTGTVSTAHNGGFIQARRDLPAGLRGDAKGLTVTVRGNGEDYHVLLKSVRGTRPWHNYKMLFPTRPDWADITLPLSGFVPSRDELPATIALEDVTGIGLAGYGRDFTAELEVARIAID